jgi:uncharacterized membrane protein (DUF4010 family)
MVVLISVLNFISYLPIKSFGSEHGVGIAGLLGGRVSCTAVTLGFSQRSLLSAAFHPPACRLWRPGCIYIWVLYHIFSVNMEDQKCR